MVHFPITLCLHLRQQSHPLSLKQTRQELNLCGDYKPGAQPTAPIGQKLEVLLCVLLYFTEFYKSQTHDLKTSNPGLTLLS